MSGSLSHTGLRARINSWYQKGKDSAVGSSFDQHVVGGYRFLMRFYNPGDDIYMFGFSRGSYIARFLAEMIDHIGLLSHGNEEMVKFAWKAFAQWQARQMSSASDEEQHERDREKQREMYRFMKGFRETFSRPVGRIRFLGLFDTVNSVPRFETAMMQRSKFPYTAKSSAKVIRHAVSIDERRAKFRQDLMYQDRPHKHHHHRHHHGGRHISQMLERVSAEMDRSLNGDEKTGQADKDERPASDGLTEKTAAGDDNEERGREENGKSSKATTPKKAPPKRVKTQEWDPLSGRYKPYRARSRSRTRAPKAESDNGSTMSGIAVSEACEEDEDEQDIDEVWFAGGHGDVGGGWEALDDRKSSSHVPLVWMIREAIRAGLPFDPDKVAELGCGVKTELREIAKNEKEGKKSPSPEVPAIRVQDGGGESSPMWEKSNQNLLGEDHAEFREVLTRAFTSPIHDSLVYGGGLSFLPTTSWKLMEWLPFRRMDLRPDGSWEPIRWPLPRGEVRDVPNNVRVHGSVIHRMKTDKNYRPGNLIIGGGGRGVRTAPEKYGIGEWECVAEPGDLVGEIWVRKGPVEGGVKGGEKRP